MEHIPMGPVMHAAPAPIMMPPAPMPVPQVSVYDIHQKNVYESFQVAPIVPVIPVARYYDTAVILVLFILLVIITRGVLHHKC